MRALLCHCRNYRSEVKKLSSAPAGIQPEPVTEKVLEVRDAIAVLVTVEEGDDISTCAPSLAEEVRIMCRDTGHGTVVLFPFGHLSNRLADSATVKSFFDALETELGDLSPKRAHFGSDKKLLLDIFGHKGNVRYREF